MYYQGGFASRYADVQWQGGLSSQDFGANTFYSAKFNNQFEATRRFLASVSADIKPLGTEQFCHFSHRLLGTATATIISSSAARRVRATAKLASHGCLWEPASTPTVHGFSARRLWEWMCAKEHIVSTAYGDALPENEGWT